MSWQVKAVLGPEMIGLGLIIIWTLIITWIFGWGWWRRDSR